MKILFVLQSLRHGGSNKSLENLLSVLDRHDMDIYMFSLSLPSPREPYYPAFSQYLLPCSALYRLCLQTACVRKALNAAHNWLHWELWDRIYDREAARLQAAHGGLSENILIGVLGLCIGCIKK